MKKSILILSAVAAMLAMTSCDSRQKLSEKLHGIWAGSPEMLTDTGASKASMVRLMEFNPTGTSGEGNVTVTAYITVENVTPANDSIVTPLQITASGTATITGMYQAKDDDELILSLDPTSMTVNVDPDAVQLNFDVMTQDSESRVTTLKPGAVMLTTQQIEHAAHSVFANMTEIDDIKVTEGMMQCEIDHRDLTFRLQSSTIK